MALIKRKSLDGYMPIAVGGVYNVGPEGGNSWVTVLQVTADDTVIVQGLDNFKADWKIKAEQFDDIVSEYYNVDYTIISPDGSVELEDGSGLVITGG